MKIIEGGFVINAEFTPAGLYELAKMDGAIILSRDTKRSWQLTPSWYRTRVFRPVRRVSATAARKGSPGKPIPWLFPYPSGAE
jgi:hypothetical protein